MLNYPGRCTHMWKGQRSRTSIGPYRATFVHIHGTRINVLHDHYRVVRGKPNQFLVMGRPGLVVTIFTQSPFFTKICKLENFFSRPHSLSCLVLVLVASLQWISQPRLGHLSQQSVHLGLVHFICVSSSLKVTVLQ